MNIVAIGLGNFGASLAKILTSLGHDVLGVDNDLNRVEYFKDSVANTICLDATDPHALRLLPIKEADVFVVCIGGDFGISVQIAALLQKFGVSRVICRESSSIHLTVLNAIGIKETFNPEYESARIIGQKLPLQGIQNLFSITDSFKIIDMLTPDFLIGEKYSIAQFKKETHLKIVALKRNHRLIFSSAMATENEDKIEIELKENDTMVLAGELKDIKRFLHE
ncbi:MAG TPA: TrkA family potassium uptake protein [Prolixibacteraceae bacterium]|nr:TrkA family potassium uptake protein [Prolixibacteraceae bacterium]